jgi:hypothetical protein
LGIDREFVIEGKAHYPLSRGLEDGEVMGTYLRRADMKSDVGASPRIYHSFIRP